MLPQISANKVPCTVTYRRTNEASKIIKVLAYVQQTQKFESCFYIYVISRFCFKVNENYTLLGYYAGSSGNSHLQGP